MSGSRARALLAVASAGVLLTAADTYVVVLALTDMMAGVGLGIESLQQATPIVSGFLLGYVAVLPLIGRLSDLLDRRRVLLGCLGVFVVGSVLTALAVELGVLVGGRFLQGVGGGGLVPATLALVADLWPPERRGTPLGVVGAVQELGAVLGPVLGAAVLAVSTWRGIFWAGALVALLLYAALLALGGHASGRHASGRHASGAAARVVAAPVVAWAAGCLALALTCLALAAPDGLVSHLTWGLGFVPIGAATSRLATPVGVAGLALGGGAAAYLMWRGRAVLARCDLPGAALVAVALGALILTFATSDPEREVIGPLGLALLPAGAVAAALAGWRLRTAAHPLVPRGVLRGRTLRAALVSGCVGAALVAVVVDVPIFARLTHTDSQTEAAYVLLRFLAAVPVGALLGGVALRRVGPAILTSGGLLAAVGGLAAMAGWTAGALAGWGSWVVLAAVGLGLGLTLAPVNAAALAPVPAQAHGATSSVLVVARMVGMVVGLALLTAVGLRRYYEATAALPDPTDGRALLAAAVVQVQSVFAGGGLAAALGVLFAAGLGGRRLHS